MVADKSEKKHVEKFHRLPSFVKPVNYNIHLKPALNDGVFEGNLVITIKIDEAIESLLLDSSDLKVKKATICKVGCDEQVVGVKEVVYLKEPIERLRLEFDKTVNVGEYDVKLDYLGVLNEKMRGFYRNKYHTKSGAEKWGATTQFEPCSARLCLPCFDEPCLKATFDCSLTVAKDLTALSNMPIIKSEDYAPDAGLKTVRYQRTPIMSTYLLAFAIGEYDFVEDVTSNGTLVRVYTPEGRSNQGKFALQFALDTLPYYETFFGIKFPLPKVDLIAIENFASGAMENWGLITFRETAVLFDPVHSSAAARQRVALVVGHELAHMWFGNLVTMDWWTDLWLNEGFATFVEHLSMENSFPEWKVWDQFVEETMVSAMNLDALANTHPIEVDVGHPHEVEEIFDLISYEKGASIIRMLYNYLGDESFQKGVSKYLEAFKYGNARTKDLWYHLAQASGKPVESVMSDWTRKEGYPYLKVDLDDKSGKITMIQRRFTLLENKSKPCFWNIPVSVSVGKQEGSAKKINVLLEAKEENSLNLEDTVSNDTPVVINSERTGFFRVLYSEKLFERLVECVKNRSIGAMDRLTLQDDLFSLSMTGLSPLLSYVELIRTAYLKESNPIVWQCILQHTGTISSLLAGKASKIQLNAYIQDIFANIYKQIGISKKSDEAHTITLLREQVLLRLVSCKHKELCDSVYAMAKSYAENDEKLDAELRHPAFSACAANGREGYNLLQKIYKKSVLMEEKVRILTHITRTDHSDIYLECLEWGLTDEIRSQDFIFLIAGGMGVEQNRHLAWKWITENWVRVNSKVPERLLARGMERVVSSHTDEAFIDEVRAFFNKNPMPQGKRSIEQACEKVQLRASVLRRDGALIDEWLKKNYSIEAGGSAGDVGAK